MGFKSQYDALRTSIDKIMNTPIPVKVESPYVDDVEEEKKEEPPVDLQQRKPMLKRLTTLTLTKTAKKKHRTWMSINNLVCLLFCKVLSDSLSLFDKNVKFVNIIQKVPENHRFLQTFPKIS